MDLFASYRNCIEYSFMCHLASKLARPGMGGNRIVCQMLAFVQPKVGRGLNRKMRGAALKVGFRGRNAAVAHKE